MKTVAHACALLLLAAIALLLPHHCAADALTQPTVIRSSQTVWGATLTVEIGRYSDSQVSFTTRLYCYLGKCSYPGPTIEVKPGDTFSLTIQNKLGAETSPMLHNLMHWPNTTNIHTHGLHVDPNVDTVFVTIAPGETHTYVYKIPANHAAGVHWYHSHVHGSSAFLIMGGLHGALVVAPAANNAQNLPTSYTSMTKQTLVFSHIQFSPSLANGVMSQGCANGAGCTVWQGCAAGTTNSPFSPFRSYSLLEWVPEIGSNVDLAPVYTGGSPTNTYVVNGQYQPTISLGVNENRLLQIVHAGGASILEFLAPPGCTLTVVALDGIYLKAGQPKMKIQMNQAARLEVMVKCNSANLTPVQVNFGDNTRVSQVLFYLDTRSSGTVNNAAIADAELAAIIRPSYLNDLTSSTADATFSVHFSQGGRPLTPCGFWLGSGSDCTAVWKGTAQPSSTITGNTCPFEAFPGQRGGTGYDQWDSTRTYKHVTSVGQVNEWKIYGLGNDAHPFHLHVNHFQVISFTPTPGSTQDFTQYYTIGEWRDTIAALDGELTIRFLASDFAGETVFHCHFLRHEDLGMMSSVYICDPFTAGACPPALDRSATVTKSSSSALPAPVSSSAPVSSTGVSVTPSSTGVAIAPSSTGASSAAVTTFTITLASRVNACPQGSSVTSAFAVNGAAQATLNLRVGVTYTFVSNFAGHVFVLTTDSTGGGSTAGAFLSLTSGSVTWSPTTAGTYYYACSIGGHTCMGAPIIVTQSPLSSSSSGLPQAVSSTGATVLPPPSSTAAVLPPPPSSTGPAGPVNTFTITTANRVNACPQGSAVPTAFALNGATQASINLQTGVAYTFIASFSGHIFVITTDSSGGGSNVGAVTGLQGGSITWTPLTPGTYYYACAIAGHTCMGAPIIVTGANLAPSSTALPSPPPSSSTGLPRLPSSTGLPPLPSSTGLPLPPSSTGLPIPPSSTGIVKLPSSTAGPLAPSSTGSLPPLAPSSTGGAPTGPVTFFTVGTAPRVAPCPQGSAVTDAFVLNGMMQPPLTIFVGTTYTFTAAFSGHVFAITTDPTNIGGSTSGVVFQLQAGATATWTPSSKGTYFYVCPIPGHTCMGTSFDVIPPPPPSSSSAAPSTTVSSTASVVSSTAARASVSSSSSSIPSSTASVVMSSSAAQAPSSSTAAVVAVSSSSSAAVSSTGQMSGAGQTGSTPAAFTGSQQASSTATQSSSAAPSSAATSPSSTAPAAQSSTASTVVSSSTAAVSVSSPSAASSVASSSTASADVSSTATVVSSTAATISSSAAAASSSTGSAAASSSGSSSSSSSSSSSTGTSSSSASSSTGTAVAPVAVAVTLTSSYSYASYQQNVTRFEAAFKADLNRALGIPYSRIAYITVLPSSSTQVQYVSRWNTKVSKANTDPTCTISFTILPATSGGDASDTSAESYATALKAQVNDPNSTLHQGSITSSVSAAAVTSQPACSDGSYQSPCPSAATTSLDSSSSSSFPWWAILIIVIGAILLAVLLAYFLSNECCGKRDQPRETAPVHPMRHDAKAVMKEEEIMLSVPSPAVVRATAAPTTAIGVPEEGTSTQVPIGDDPTAAAAPVSPRNGGVELTAVKIHL